ncbi:MAG TPA: hypothetical protein VFB63_10300 [Bryobacteraceae bacterium]|nr:hypothetical protein [Bryobacteraceae bacterium]
MTKVWTSIVVVAPVIRSFLLVAPVIESSLELDAVLPGRRHR